MDVINFGTLNSYPVVINGEIGTFSVPIELDRDFFLSSPDKKRMLFAYIANLLAHNMQTCDMPRDMWYVEFSQTAQRKLSLPATLDLSGDEV